MNTEIEQKETAEVIDAARGSLTDGTESDKLGSKQDTKIDDAEAIEDRYYADTEENSVGSKEVIPQPKTTSDYAKELNIDEVALQEFLDAKKGEKLNANKDKEELEHEGNFLKWAANANKLSKAQYENATKALARDKEDVAFEQFASSFVSEFESEGEELTEEQRDVFANLTKEEKQSHYDTYMDKHVKPFTDAKEEYIVEAGTLALIDRQKSIIESQDKVFKVDISGKSIDFEIGSFSFDDYKGLVDKSVLDTQMSLLLNDQELGTKVIESDVLAKRMLKNLPEILKNAYNKGSEDFKETQSIGAKVPFGIKEQVSRTSDESSFIELEKQRMRKQS